MSTATAASPDPTARAVVDASVVVRAYLGRYALAERWLESVVSWPSLVYIEVPHALLRLHRQQRIPLPRAQAALQSLHALVADVHPVESLAQQAWDTALARRLSVSDACYVVLAERLDVPLVTADRGLAAATPNAVLLT